MNRMMKVLKLTLEIEEARNTIRRLWGDKYNSLIEPARCVVRRVMQAEKCSALVAVTKIDRTQVTDMQMVAIIAAAADVAEETP